MNTTRPTHLVRNGRRYGHSLRTGATATPKTHAASPIDGRPGRYATLCGKTWDEAEEYEGGRADPMEVGDRPTCARCRKSLGSN